MKRALLIGIDEYQNFGKLKGCVNDVSALAPLLAKNADGSRNFECRVLRSDRDAVGRKDIIGSINNLLAPGAEVALFYFAGHGTGMANDVSLASSDGDWTEPGVPLSLLLGKAQNTDINQVIIILDCCHSGGGGGDAMLGSNVALIRNGVAVMAAARADQIAKETEDGRGQFSSYLSAALDGGAADITGKVSLAGVYAFLAECFGAWDQRPTFKANLEDSYELRRTMPLVPIEMLRQLPAIFSSMLAELPLDPTYERESPTCVPDRLAVYDVLSRCRDAKLVEPVGTDYLFHAAMESKSCRLTPHGRHYWQLAAKDLL